MGRNMEGDMPPRTLNRLSPLKVQKVKTKGLHADGGGLYLRVSESGTKAWMFRWFEDGRTRDHGLGPIHTIGLPKARELARECRELRLQGVDPIAYRRASVAARKVSDAKVMSFKQCADAYIASHEAAWHNASHRSQWVNTLAQHVYPTLGALPVAEIDTALVMKAIEPIWKTIPETASRVRGRIEIVLDWARVAGYRSGENPARWRGHLDHLLPAKSKLQRVEHHAALPYTEIGAFMSALNGDTSEGARALKFLILTSARSGEVLGAKRTEIDAAAKIWTVPPERMKGKRQHRVPLSPAALTLVEGGEMFGRLGEKAMRQALHRLGRDDLTVHGFRSTFRDWAAERTNFPPDVVEMALAHAIPDAVEKAYRRGDLFEKRRLLMQAWADYCAKPAVSGEVVAMRRTR
jgi:integrase